MSIVLAVSLLSGVVTGEPYQASGLFGDELLNLCESRGPELSYWGGPVMSAVTAYAVMWGPNVDAGTKTRMGDFLSAFTESALFDWMDEYHTDRAAADGLPGSHQHIGRGTYAGMITLSPTHGSASLVTDADIQDELNAAFASHKLPPPTDTNIFLVFFPPGVSITNGGDTSCQQFCAYHGAIRRSAQNARYAVMPDLGSGGCEAGCDRAATTFDNLTIAVSHEIIEAVTDPDINTFTDLVRPNAWYDIQRDAAGELHGEIGDICNGMPTPLVAPNGEEYAMQKQWSNADRACKGIVTDDFSITLDPPVITVHPNTAATVKVKLKTTKGNPGRVNLRRALVPMGGMVNFSQGLTDADSEVEMRLQVDASTLNATYYIGILGDTAQISRRVPLEVHVVGGVDPDVGDICTLNPSSPVCHFIGCNGSGGASWAAVGFALALVLRRRRATFVSV